MARNATQRSFELLWKEYFRDPSRWDNRKSKAGLAYPDFQNKITRHSLWNYSCFNPFWVLEGLRKRSLIASMQSHHDDTQTHDEKLSEDHGHALHFTNELALHGQLSRYNEKPSHEEMQTLHAELPEFHEHSLRFSHELAPHREVQPFPDKVTHVKTHVLNHECTAFVTLIRACTKKRDLYRGIRVHNDVMKRGLIEQCSDDLVTMYAKCGALAKAKELLNMYKSRNVFSWTSVIAGYARQGQGHDALTCFEEMQHEGLSPDAVTFACILKACGTIKAYYKGEQIHDEIARQGLLGNSIVLGNALIDMYAKCGDLAKAQRVLDELPTRDVVSWSALIQGYAEQSQGENALKCFERMQSEGLSPNSVTYMCILKACGSIGAANKGEQIHDEISRRGLLKSDVVLGTALVDMYAKCGALEKAQQVLEKLCVRDVVSWNALITRYAVEGQGEQALNCLEQMQREGLSPDSVTFLSILKACSSIEALEKGEQIHDEIVRQGLLQNSIVLGTALVDMYAKCGSLMKAQQVLENLPSQDIISWSALIAGYVQQGKAEQALVCFEQMQREGFPPNEVTFLCIVKACASVGAIDKGEQIHDEIIRQGLLEKDILLGNALVDMYAKCGALEKAQQVLEELPVQDIVSWNVIISGYAQEGKGTQALECFERMQHEGLSPNAVTFLCIIKACGIIGLVDDAHTHFLSMSTKYGIKPDVEHYTCIVDVFGRAGHLDKAAEIIKKMTAFEHSLAVWSAMLGACQEWGDVKYGRWAFENAVKVDKSDATAYVLMANIYAAAGMQEEAENIDAMRMEIGHGRN